MENNQTMKASELRIGNLVYWDIPEKINVIHKVIGIRENGQIHTCPISFANLMNNDIKPIPLTEEWLLRMGFEPHFGTYILKTNRGIILIEEDLAEISFNETQRGFNAPCKYVHQLQNLYFALTNQELEIKE